MPPIRLPLCGRWKCLVDMTYYLASFFIIPAIVAESCRLGCDDYLFQPEEIIDIGTKHLDALEVFIVLNVIRVWRLSFAYIVELVLQHYNC